MTDDTLTLEVGGYRLTGWKSVRVTRGLERMPSDFTLSVTERAPEGNTIAIMPGAPCVVRLGADVVLTGYVDRYDASVAKGQHAITVSGRGKCEDLVDCAAVYSGNQISAASVLQLAQDLTKPYSITASGEAGPAVPQFNINLGETVWEILDAVTRYGGLLAYEGTDGNLILSRVGTEEHSSGFATGQNAQLASASLSMDGRYSEYVAAYMSVDRLRDAAGEGGNQVGTVKDEGVPRFRRRVIVSEQTVNGLPLAMARATWERNRRWGRSQAVRVTCDSWRDSAGRLWTPNMLARVDCPQIKVAGQTWIIGEVTYTRDKQGGTVTEVSLMPPEAFSVEPTVLNPFSADLDAAIGQARAAQPPAGR